MQMRARGFTLIEILVVMVIISVVGGIALLSIHHNENTRYDRLARELANRLTLAQEQAMLQPTILGLTLDETHFQFYEYRRDTKTNKDHWEPIESPELGSHPLPDDIKLTVKVRNKVLPTGNYGAPALIISTSGDIIPFTILIGKPGSAPRYQVVGSAEGTITSGPIQP
jgi:general secretion pathway protein H